MGILGERWSADSPHFHEGGNLLNAKPPDRTDGVMLCVCVGCDEQLSSLSQANEGFCKPAADFNRDI